MGEPCYYEILETVLEEPEGFKKVLTGLLTALDENRQQGSLFKEEEENEDPELVRLKLKLALPILRSINPCSEEACRVLEELSVLELQRLREMFWLLEVTVNEKIEEKRESNQLTIFGTA